MTSKRIVKIRENQRGNTILGTLISLSIVSAVILGQASFFGNSVRRVKFQSFNDELYQLRKKIVSTVKSKVAWDKTINDVSNDTSFKCIRQGSSCTGKGGLFSLIDEGGNPLVSASGGEGFDRSGNKCSGFNETTGNDDCPIRVEVTWLPICKAPCNSDERLLEVNVNFKYKPATQYAPVNADVNRFSIVRQAVKPLAGCNASSTDPTEFGGGTNPDPYVICNGKQIKAISSNSSIWGNSFKLNQDVDLTSVSFDPIGDNSNPFEGTFDGGGFEVKGFKYSSTTQKFVGLFGYIGTNGVVRNLNLRGFDTKALGHVGTLAGWNRGKVSNVFVVDSKVESLTGYAGGLFGAIWGGHLTNFGVGQDFAESLDSNSRVTVKGSTGGIGGAVGVVYCGRVDNGIVGWPTILNGANEGIGGFAGSILKSSNTICASVGAEYGISNIKVSFDSESIEANKRVGGFGGICSDSKILNLIVKGTMTDQNHMHLKGTAGGASIGGAFGYGKNCVVDNVVVTLNVDGSKVDGGVGGVVGGFIGTYQNEINNSNYSGKILGAEQGTGGIAGGFTDGSISNVRVETATLPWKAGIDVDINGTGGSAFAIFRLGGIVGAGNRMTLINGVVDQFDVSGRAVNSGSKVVRRIALGIGSCETCSQVQNLAIKSSKLKIERVGGDPLPAGGPESIAGVIGFQDHNYSYETDSVFSNLSIDSATIEVTSDTLTTLVSRVGGVFGNLDKSTTISNFIVKNTSLVIKADVVENVGGVFGVGANMFTPYGNSTKDLTVSNISIQALNLTIGNPGDAAGRASNVKNVGLFAGSLLSPNASRMTSGSVGASLANSSSLMTKNAENIGGLVGSNGLSSEIDNSTYSLDTTYLNRLTCTANCVPASCAAVNSGVILSCVGP